MKNSQRMVEFEWIVFVRISWGVWRMLLFVCFSFILANSYVCGDCCIAFFFVQLLLAAPYYHFYYYSIYGKKYLEYILLHVNIVLHTMALWAEWTHTKNAIRITIFVEFMDVNRCTKFNYIHFSCDTNTSRRAQ